MKNATRPITLGYNELRSIIRESVQSILKEESSSKEYSEDSIDLQIDKYLSVYEKDSKSVKSEGLDFRIISRNFFSNVLLEEDEKDDTKSDPTKKLTLDDIDVEHFASNVVRLIDNYDSLLEIRDTIARRAMNFLLKNYEEDVSTQFMLVLEEQYDLKLGDSTYEKLADNQPPPAARAGASEGGSV